MDVQNQEKVGAFMNLVEKRALCRRSSHDRRIKDDFRTNVSRIYSEDWHLRLNIRATYVRGQVVLLQSRGQQPFYDFARVHSMPRYDEDRGYVMTGN